MRTHQRSTPMIIFSIFLMAFAAFCVWNMFLDERPPQRTVRDVPKMNADACRAHGGVKASDAIDTRRGNLTSMLTTCNDGTVKQVSPDYPNPKYVEYQKNHPIKGDDGLLFVIVLVSVVGILGGVFGFAIFVVEVFD